MQRGQSAGSQKKAVAVSPTQKSTSTTRTSGRPSLGECIVI